ncbi:MAG: hypothetical protein ABIG89_04185 [Candidatus Woesearchaeota archaeon]
MEKNQAQTQKTYLKAESIIKYLKGDNDLETAIMCGTANNLVTSDQSLYEALGSIGDKSIIDLNKLVKFLEVVEIISYTKNFRRQRIILTPKRAEELNNIIEKDEMDDINNNESKVN